MNPAQSERHALCNLFLEVGPDAPTLCEDWTTRDLAAHIIVRESRPDAAGGILIKPLAAYGEKVRKGVAQRDWKSLVEAIRNGPPRLSPMRLTFLDRLTNTVEFFVHLEDVRRAQPNLHHPRRPTVCPQVAVRSQTADHSRPTRPRQKRRTCRDRNGRGRRTHHVCIRSPRSRTR